LAVKNVFFLSQSGIPDPADPDYDGEKDHGTQKGVQEGDSPILDSLKSSSHAAISCGTSSTPAWSSINSFFIVCIYFSCTVFHYII
jgi:hypothetical protein